MNIHEYQAKAVLKGFGVSVPQGGIAFSSDEAVQHAESLGGPVWVVKAQIHAGGRGKGGGVKVVKSVDDVRAEADRMLGMTLIILKKAPKLNVSYISPFLWIVRPLKCPSLPQPKAVWILRKWRPKRPKRF
jgi:succinyl-CoA synthetase beta subunit